MTALLVIDKVLDLGRTAPITGVVADWAGITLGPVPRPQNVRLVESTTSTPGRQAVRFGVRYVVYGVPKGAAIELKLIRCFADIGLVDGDNRTRHFQSEYKVRSVVGSVGYRSTMMPERG